MEETDIKRKLATILVADIVGYSRLTANDEDWTIRALGDFRKIVDDIIARHDGRIFSTGGDSVLAEFASPVEAVRAAVDFQEASRSRNLLQPRDRQLRYRIGINLGDVMVRGSDLLGDGVNVAARLEGILPRPGGICVSASVWEHINGKLSIGYVDIGEQSVKNIPRPVRAYHLRVDGSVGEVAEASDAALKPAPDSMGSSAARRQRAPIAAMLAAALGTALVIGAGIAVWQFWPKGHPAPGPSAKRVAEAPAAAPQAAAPAKPIVIPPAPPSPTPSPTTTAQASAPAAPTQTPAAASPPATPPTTAQVSPQPAPTPAPAPTVTASAPPKTFRDCTNCPEMVVIPAGSFQMGAASGENQRYDVPPTEAGRDEPQHRVTFAKPFALGKFDVTRAEFAAFAKAANFRARPGCMTVNNGNWTPQEQASWENPGFPQPERYTIVCMNDLEIGAYLAWLRLQSVKDYRLPSEAEWEYAERGGTTTTFHWGDDAKDACTYENVADETHKDKYGGAAMPCRDGFADTAPVGSFKPNPFGLHDMAGNVYVLTADCWNQTYAGAPTDGSAWMSGDCARHPARKAGFGTPRPWAFRAANRLSEGSLVKRNRFGFPRRA